MRSRTRTFLALGLAFVFLTCGGEVRREAGDLLTDAGTWLLDMDATAQSPTTPARVITADTDLARMESRILTSDGTPQQLAEGPMVVTDLGAFGGGASFWVGALGCTTTTTVTIWVADRPITGARLAVPAGRALCMNSGGYTVTWSGFRPYE